MSRRPRIFKRGNGGYGSRMPGLRNALQGLLIWESPWPFILSLGLGSAEWKPSPPPRLLRAFFRLLQRSHGRSSLPMLHLFARQPPDNTKRCPFASLAMKPPLPLGSAMEREQEALHVPGGTQGNDPQMHPCGACRAWLTWERLAWSTAPAWPPTLQSDPIGGPGKGGRNSEMATVSSS